MTTRDNDDVDAPIVREAPPRVTPLTGDESAPDKPTLAAIAWLVRRYSSHAYIERARTLLRLVTAAFGKWASTDPPVSTAVLRGTQRLLSAALAEFDRGLAQLAGGHKTVAYAAFADAVRFRDDLLDGRAARNLSLQELQDHLGPAVGLAAARACAMALRIRHTLAATWTVERILSDSPAEPMRPRRLPDPLPPAPVPDGPPKGTGDEVEQTGIWLPTTIRDACPNLLIAGHVAPPLTRASERIDYPAWPGGEDDPPEPAWTDWEWTEEPTAWRLAWPDERYRDGLIVPEPEFLDEDNAIPEGLG